MCVCTCVGFIFFSTDAYKRREKKMKILCARVYCSVREIAAGKTDTHMRKKDLLALFCIFKMGVPCVLVHIYT